MPRAVRGVAGEGATSGSDQAPASWQEDSSSRVASPSLSLASTDLKASQQLMAMLKLGGGRKEGGIQAREEGGKAMLDDERAGSLQPPVEASPSRLRSGHGGQEKRAPPKGRFGKICYSVEELEALKERVKPLASRPSGLPPLVISSRDRTGVPHAGDQAVRRQPDVPPRYQPASVASKPGQGSERDAKGRVDYALLGSDMPVERLRGYREGERPSSRGAYSHQFSQREGRMPREGGPGRGGWDREGERGRGGGRGGGRRRDGLEGGPTTGDGHRGGQASSERKRGQAQQEEDLWENPTDDYWEMPSAGGLGGGGGEGTGMSGLDKAFVPDEGLAAAFEAERAKYLRSQGIQASVRKPPGRSGRAAPAEAEEEEAPAWAQEASAGVAQEEKSRGSPPGLSRSPPGPCIPGRIKARASPPARPWPLQDLDIDLASLLGPPPPPGGQVARLDTGTHPSFLSDAPPSMATAGGAFPTSLFSFAAPGAGFSTIDLYRDLASSSPVTYPEGAGPARAKDSQGPQTGHMSSVTKPPGAGAAVATASSFPTSQVPPPARSHSPPGTPLARPPSGMEASLRQAPSAPGQGPVGPGKGPTPPGPYRQGIPFPSLPPPGLTPFGRDSTLPLPVTRPQSRPSQAPPPPPAQNGARSAPVSAVDLSAMLFKPQAGGHPARPSPSRMPPSPVTSPPGPQQPLSLPPSSQHHRSSQPRPQALRSHPFQEQHFPYPAQPPPRQVQQQQQQQQQQQPQQQQQQQQQQPQQRQRQQQGHHPSNLSAPRESPTQPPGDLMAILGFGAQGPDEASHARHAPQTEAETASSTPVPASKFAFHQGPTNRVLKRKPPGLNAKTLALTRGVIPSSVLISSAGKKKTESRTQVTGSPAPNPMTEVGGAPAST